MKLSNKYIPIIKQAKDEVKVAEFDGVQADSRMKEQRVRLTELERNAEQEKAKRLEAIDPQEVFMIHNVIFFLTSIKLLSVLISLLEK